MEIAIIGAGSHFTLHLLRSLYQSDPHANHHLRFMDLRAEPLAALDRLVPRLNHLTGASVRHTCYQDQARAIEGADHVLVSFAVDFPASFLRTCWVMHNHGIRFVEGETATPGALMATLRHLPPLIAVTQDVQRYTDGAWVHIINNPMPRLIRGVLLGTGYARVVGHCHGTLDTRERVAGLTGVPAGEINLVVAGINHFHLVQQAVDRRDGRNLLPVIEQLTTGQDGLWEQQDYTQWRLYHEIGHFIGCGNWHTFDYVPYSNWRMFRHTDYNTWERSCLAVLARQQAGLQGELGSHLKDDTELRAFLNGYEREQMFAIMRALAGDTPPYPYLSGNMPNGACIPELPADTIVELPATVTPQGVTLNASPAPLPLLFASWVRQQVAVHELSVRAVLDQSRQAAIEAIAADPAFRDCDCGPGQLFDEMAETNEAVIPHIS